MRPPRVRTHSFPPSIRRIYTSGPCSCRASSCFADLPTFVCLMRFLFVGSVVCRRLPSAHASRRWPCHWLCAWRYLLHSGLAPIRTRPCRAHKKAANSKLRGRFCVALSASCIIQVSLWGCQTTFVLNTETPCFFSQPRTVSVLGRLCDR